MSASKEHAVGFERVRSNSDMRFMTHRAFCASPSIGSVSLARLLPEWIHTESASVPKEATGAHLDTSTRERPRTKSVGTAGCVENNAHHVSSISCAHARRMCCAFRCVVCDRVDDQLTSQSIVRIFAFLLSSLDGCGGLGRQPLALFILIVAASCLGHVDWFCPFLQAR